MKQAFLTKEGIMAIEALGFTTNIAKQFKQKVPVKNTRRSKTGEQFQQVLDQKIQPVKSFVDFRA
jgi:hypothetical protein